MLAVIIIETIRVFGETTLNEERTTAVTRASRDTPRVTGHTGLRWPHVCGPAGEIPENMRPPRNFANAMIAAARRRCAVVVPDFEHTSSSPRPPRRRPTSAIGP